MYNPQYPYSQAPGLGYQSPAAIEARVPGFIASVFAWMTVGLAVTGVIAFLTANAIVNSPTIADTVYGSPVIFIGVLVVQLVLVLAISAAATRLPMPVATFLFLLYAAINGVWISGLFLIYSSDSIERAFYVTAGTFAIMAIVGYTTRMNLSRLGPILFMGLIGIILATLVNFFFHSDIIQTVVTYLGVLIFVGLTAYDTQKLKRLAMSGGTSGGLAIRGALMLYLDFLNLFLFILRILGRSRN